LADPTDTTERWIAASLRINAGLETTRWAISAAPSVPFNRQRRHGRLNDRLAGAIAHLRAHTRHLLRMPGTDFNFSLVGAVWSKFVASRSGRRKARHGRPYRASDDRVKVRARKLPFVTATTPLIRLQLKIGSASSDLHRLRRCRRATALVDRSLGRAFPMTVRSASDGTEAPGAKASSQSDDVRPRFSFAERPELYPTTHTVLTADSDGYVNHSGSLQTGCPQSTLWMSHVA
jgi:hypothetical protein